MATYMYFSGSDSFTLETGNNVAFDDAAAFDLLDYFDSEGIIEATGAQVYVRRNIEADIPDPRTP